MTKQELFQVISDAADYGNICLFVGAGFSKAVFKGTDIDPPSWIQLLKKVYDIKGIRFDESKLFGKSCPEIASHLVSEMMKSDETLSYENAVNSIKTIICREVQYIPNEEQCSRFALFLKSLAPECIITTNYDLVLETILPDIGYPLTPTDCLNAPKKYVPIYHLHGICQSPSSIIITNEDYVQLFRPNDYRLEKLALIMKESTVIFLGYGIGDPNVQTSIDWADNVYNGLNVENAKKIQVVYEENPSSEIIENGDFLIVETEDLSSLLAEFQEFRRMRIEENKRRINAIAELKGKFLSSEISLIDYFISNEENRRTIIRKTLENRVDLLVPFQFFLKNVFRKCWENARPAGAFEAYNDMTKIMLDLLEVLDLRNPSFFVTIASEFARLAEFVGDKYYGQSFSAGRTWNNRKANISEDICRKLRQYGYEHSYWLEKLMDDRLGD